MISLTCITYLIITFLDVVVVVPRVKVKDHQKLF